MPNPNTDLPNHASSKPTWSFHERYASDAEFKRQVDEGRRRATANRTLKEIQAATSAVKHRKKLY